MLGIESAIVMADSRPRRGSHRPGAILVCLGRNSLRSLYSVRTIGLAQTTLRGDNLEAHGFTIIVILTNPERINRKDTKYYEIVYFDSRR